MKIQEQMKSFSFSTASRMTAIIANSVFSREISPFSNFSLRSNNSSGVFSNVSDEGREGNGIGINNAICLDDT